MQCIYCKNSESKHAHATRKVHIIMKVTTAIHVPSVHLCVEDETDVVHELVALVPLVANIFRMAHKLHTDRDVGTQQTVFRKTRQHWPTCRPKAATLIKCPVEEFYDLSTL